MHDVSTNDFEWCTTEHTFAIFGAPNQVVLRWVHGPVCRSVVHNKNLRIRCVSVGSLSRAGPLPPTAKAVGFPPHTPFWRSTNEVLVASIQR